VQAIHYGLAQWPARPRIGGFLNGIALHAELVKHGGEDAGDFRRLAAFDLAAMQHVHRLSILE